VYEEAEDRVLILVKCNKSRG